MGGCACRGARVVLSREHLMQLVVRAIEEDDLATIIDIHSLFKSEDEQPYIFPSFSFDDPIVSIHGVELNTLSFCFRAGHIDIARYLIEKVGCSVSRMYAIFRGVGKTPLHILCEYGHLPLLMYFLPIHLGSSFSIIQSQSLLRDVSEEISSFQAPQEKAAFYALANFRATPSMQSPIHRACEYGHLNVVAYLWQYSLGRDIHSDFDVHAVDERTGENCALISARTGNFLLMEFLHTECKADFHRKTTRRESSLQLLVLDFKHHKSMQCAKYLVEEIKVDIKYEYEETLLLCEDSELQSYIEEKLAGLGIAVQKQQVEDRYAIRRAMAVPMTRTFMELEERARLAGEHFQMQELFREELAADAVSSIPPESMTPFSNFSRNLTPELLAETHQT